MMVRSAFAVAVAILALASPSAVRAATSPSILPETASPGEPVTFLNGCLGVLDEPPATVQVAFVEGDEVPENPSTPKAAGELIDRFTYEFVVPDVPPGSYVVLLECLPGNWSTNLSEPGGGAPLEVRDAGEVSCEDVGTCVVFDPPASRPGAVVTVTPGADSLEIPLFGECPEGDRFVLALNVNNQLVYSPLSGTAERATFVVPDVPAGEYEADTWCLGLNIGQGVGTFAVLKMPDTATAVARREDPPIGVLVAAALAGAAVALLRQRRAAAGLPPTRRRAAPRAYGGLRRNGADQPGEGRSGAMSSRAAPKNGT